MLWESDRNERSRLFTGSFILPGSFFHEQIARPIFESIARGRDADMPLIFENRTADAAKLTERLWGHFSQRYVTAALTGPDRPPFLSDRQLLSFSHGIGLLAEFLVDLILKQRPHYNTSRDLVRGVFLPPEQALRDDFSELEDLKILMSGRYDALVFDRDAEKFIVLEFKCRDANELIGDLQQVSLYAWLIRKASGVPARGAIIYVNEPGEIKRFSAEDLEAGFDASRRLIREMARWLLADDRASAGIPPTTVPGFCEHCPLNATCDDLFGYRDPALLRRFEARLKSDDVEFPPPPAVDEAASDKGVLLGRSIDAPERTIHWNFSGGEPRLANAHMLIVGTSGSGKTQVLKAIIAELIERSVTPLIFDFNDDYVRDGFPDRHGLHVVNPLDGLPLNPLEVAPDPTDGMRRIMNSVFEVAGILKRIYGLGDQQEANLRTALHAAYAERGINGDLAGPPANGYPGFEEVESKIEEIPKSITLRNRLQPIFSLNLFNEEAAVESFGGFVDRPIVVRLTALPTEQVKLATAEFVLMKLYNHLVSGAHSPAPTRAVVIDEAHKLSSSKAVLTLFREIRKYGAGIILSSQKAGDFDADIHANAASGLYLKNSEIKDRRYVADQLKSSEKDKNEIANLLSQQNTFEGLFRNDQHKPYVRVRVKPYFEREY